MWGKADVNKVLLFGCVKYWLTASIYLDRQPKIVSGNLDSRVCRWKEELVPKLPLTITRALSIPCRPGHLPNFFSSKYLNGG